MISDILTDKTEGLARKAFWGLKKFTWRKNARISDASYVYVWPGEAIHRAAEDALHKKSLLPSQLKLLRLCFFQRLMNAGACRLRAAVFL
jgi:hypothetical protein